MRPSKSGLRAFALAVTGVTVISGGALTALGSSPAGATDSTQLYGEGGSYMAPVISKLMQDDQGNLAPLAPFYSDNTIDNGIQAFIGSAPGAFNADFAVSERPLTSAESATASHNGRPYAYVPIAAGPVAIVTLITNSTYRTGSPLVPSSFCQGMPLSLVQLGNLFGTYRSWTDPLFNCSGPGTTTGGYAVTRWANLDPTMENSAVINLLDTDTSTGGAASLWTNGLANLFSLGKALTQNPAPSEFWPLAEGGSIPGGDQPLLGKLLAIDARTNTPSTNPAYWQLGAIVPMSSVWAGAPLGTTLDLPTAAIVNAQGSYVAPTTASAGAAESDATLAATTDPTTNNLVTFNPAAADAAAYNNYLMEETYLVVPLSGLPADKSAALAQFIRFSVGPVGGRAIAQLGAAPVTPAMATADLRVADELDAQAALASTTSTTAPAGTTTTVPVGAGSKASTTASATGNPSPGANGAADGGSSSGGSSASGLAFTGSPALLLPMAAVGATLVAVGSAIRRRQRRRTRTGDVAA